VQHSFPVSSNEPQGSISLFSLLSFSQKTEDSLARKFAGEGRNDDMDQMPFKEILSYREESSGKRILPQGALPQRNQ
jgi:hypothetical protein